MAMHGLVLSLLLILLAGGAEAFRICAFNAQRLAQPKVAKKSVMDTLVQMWGHYFLPLGFPRSDKTQVLSSYQYNDTDDVFAREPFVAQFTLPSKILPNVVLVPLHTTPKDVEKELNALYDVFLDVSQRWQNEDVILLGDFNADCASLTKKRLNSLLLRTKAGFHWVISDGEDTTVRASTNCTYDRIVMHGQGCQTLLKAAAPFNFPRSFQLTEEEALRISDHYPVEVELSQAAQGIQPFMLGYSAAAVTFAISAGLGGLTLPFR
ncbi:Deoxyribonuclease-1-like 1 [Microtus ochrogaster]|uniref:Deoxyribonuclease n=1 Tax=Microtus ochrogaster TaxID=79684 RepID=A0A8J6KRB2_MICOH|nr:Deoxyribonuclease-1-like 1 [Microtus ochrogaster]